MTVAAHDPVVPHGPDEPCTCSGCWGCSGHVIGCTCDIDWDAVAERDRPALAELVLPGSLEDLRSMLAEDAQQHPQGHPCRDCGRLFHEHPWRNEKWACGGWR